MWKTSTVPIVGKFPLVLRGFQMESAPGNLVVFCFSKLVHEIVYVFVKVVVLSQEQV